MLQVQKSSPKGVSIGGLTQKAFQPADIIMFGFFKRRKDKKAQSQTANEAESSVVLESTPVAEEERAQATPDINPPLPDEMPVASEAAELPAEAEPESEVPAPISTPVEPPIDPGAPERPNDITPVETQANVQPPSALEVTQPPVDKIEPYSSSPELSPLESVQPQESVQPLPSAPKAKTQPVDKEEAAPSEPEPEDEAVTASALKTENAPALENVAEIDSKDGVDEPEPQVQPETQEKPRKKGLFARLKEGLSKTRSGFTEGLANLLLGKKTIDDDLLEELETQLIMADVGIEATQSIIASLTEKVSRKELKDSDALYAALKSELTHLLTPVEQPLDLNDNATPNEPYVILMVGVNGVGKTTTIGKLAKKFQAEGKSVMLAAGDTFRAAAVEQLQVWGQRNNVPVVAQHTGADSASVIFDAIQSAKTKGVDVIIADTAGRLHNKSNLMQELEKVVRVMKKINSAAPHEVLLVLDACTGQNALNQAKQFQQAVGVSGLALTKLDGTAKGGIIFAIAKQLKLPVRFIGVGERAEDLRTFQAEAFVDALFDAPEN